MSTADFDVLDYVASTRGSLRAELTGRDADLPDDLVAVLRYLRRRAGETTAWLRVVLVTATHKDARATAFLSSWAYERHWIADALAALSGDPVERAPERTRRQRVDDRFGPLTEAVVGTVHGTALTAVHMAERLVDGYVQDALLARLAELAPAAVADDLARIRATIDRQQRFFLESATTRLAAQRRARALTRTRLRRHAWPLGADGEPAETAHVFDVLFAGKTDWARAVDRRIDAVPGLAGLRLVERSAANPGRPALRIPLRLAAALGRAAASITRRKGDGALAR